MTNEFQISGQNLSLEELATIEANARLERALVLRSIATSVATFIRSKFSAKTTPATA